MAKVKTGLDVLMHGSCRSLRGVRAGILSHQASVDGRLRHIAPLLQARQVRITTLFAPEHGFWGSAQDQVPIASDSSTVPVHSLYGDKRAPTADMLADVDVLI